MVFLNIYKSLYLVEEELFSLWSCTMWPQLSWIAWVLSLLKYDLHKKRFLHSYTSKLLHKYSVTIFLLMIKNILRFLSWTHEQQYLYSSECCFIFATHSVLSTCSFRGSLCNIYARLKAEWTTKPLLRRKWRWRNMTFQCIEKTYIFITILNLH